MSMNEYKPRHLFSTSATLKLIEMVSKDPLLAFDFDGTLTPIQEQPGHVFLTPDHNHALEKMCLNHKIAILSGRAISDIEHRISFHPHYLVGNHGAEHRDAVSLESSQVDEELSQFRHYLNPIRYELMAQGVVIEDKIRSIALHYRFIKNFRVVNSLFMRLKQAAHHAVTFTKGKMVLNVSAKSAPNKLDALNGILNASQKHHAIYFGDDTNDEPIFQCQNPEYFSVMVGKSSRLSANYYVDNAAQVYEALEVISEIKKHLQ